MGGKSIASEPQPFLRWAGSKRQLVPELARYWSNGYARYVEPFAGSACLFFHLAPPKALLADINRELIITYKQVRSRPAEVAAVLRRLRRGKNTFLQLRKVNPYVLRLPERAARFIYLNRFCFNGLYRTNRRGEFNVPFGGQKTGAKPTQQHLRACSLLLARATIAANSFERTLERVRPGDFVYMDPPFSITARRVFNEYDASSFGTEQLRSLRQWMIRLEEMAIPFLVSYADSHEARQLSRGFHVRATTVRRSIAGFAGGRAPDTELLISNRLPSHRGEAGHEGF